MRNSQNPTKKEDPVVENLGLSSSRECSVDQGESESHEYKVQGDRRGKMEIRVIDVKICCHSKIRAIATIELVGLVKICGIKIVAGERGTYCVPPNQSYLEDGMRKWANILTFERNIWNEIQKKALNKYEEVNRDK